MCCAGSHRSDSIGNGFGWSTGDTSRLPHSDPLSLRRRWSTGQCGQVQGRGASLHANLRSPLISVSFQVASALLDLVPVIDAFLATSKIASFITLDNEIVALFRSMWYLSVLSGFLSTPSRISDWQRSALGRIAEQTPCLLHGAGDDFAETDLQFNSILRRTNHTLVCRFVSYLRVELTTVLQSPDTARAELAAAVVNQASHIRTISTSHAVFLLTVLRVESLRAENGRPSTVLSYFHNDGVNSGPLFAVLASIADQVRLHPLAELRDADTVLAGQRYVRRWLQRPRHSPFDQYFRLRRSSRDPAAVRSPKRSSSISIDAIPQRPHRELPLLALRSGCRQGFARIAHRASTSLSSRVYR